MCFSRNTVLVPFLLSLQPALGRRSKDYGEDDLPSRQVVGTSPAEYEILYPIRKIGRSAICQSSTCRNRPPWHQSRLFD